MNQNMTEDEVLSNSQLSMSSSRRNSSISSLLFNANTRSRRNSIPRRRSSFLDPNDPNPEKQQTPSKVLVFRGKCSETFKLALQDCVEDCVLEFPTEKSTIYVPKSRQSTQLPIFNKQSTTLSWKEPTTDLSHQLARSRRRSSGTLLNIPQIGGRRPSQTSNVSIPTTTLLSTTAARLRQPTIVPQKFTCSENISEEIITTDFSLNPIVTESDFEQPHVSEEEIRSRQSTSEIQYQFPLPSYRKFPSSTGNKPNRDRQKNYLLSDLVMFGPEYFSNVFNLPHPTSYRTQTSLKQSPHIQQRYTKTTEKYNELSQVRQDLFHRYLWTQKPQVACRIRPLTTHGHRTTFVT